MCVLKYHFIDKKSLKKHIQELVIKNYLMIEVYNTYTINNLNIEHIMNEHNKKRNTNI